MGLRELEEQVDAAAETMTPGVRGLLGLLRAASLVLRLMLVATVLIGAIIGGAWGAPLGPVALFMGLGLGVAVGLVPEVVRRAFLIVGYRSVLSRGVLKGLQAVGGSTSVALPTFTGPKSLSPSPPPTPAFVAPIRPPPRVGDPDADDFDD